MTNTAVARPGSSSAAMKQSGTRSRDGTGHIPPPRGPHANTDRERQRKEQQGRDHVTGPSSLR